MKKLIFGALALAMFTVTSCRNDQAETTEETVEETATIEEANLEMTTEAEEIEEVEMTEEVDSSAVEVEQETPAIQ
ncbi:hypothetical protein MKO06_03870 [Gramella sp. GC03-9]|uniref:Uncharacterized protein n=1 Tax=Christiangramia oceanisediminis TaxID=2920386 RepID=A0A9X2I155_9FLAO|nr:hypothetical protein [Gramella oceanisediminis]MCP9199031.1 hypothetical protein [Gramella oceanisediminis]